MLTVQRIEVADWPVWRALRLAALAEAPEAFGARLSDWHGAGDQPERWQARLRDVAANFVAYLDGQPVGMASGTNGDADGSGELISFWVAPEARGRRVTDALVAAVAEWVVDEGLTPLTLQVKIANERARAAYRRCGFRDAPDRPAVAAAPDELTMVYAP